MTWLSDWLTPPSAPDTGRVSSWEPEEVMVELPDGMHGVATAEHEKPVDAAPAAPAIDIAAIERAAYERGRADGMAAGEAQAWERVRAVVQGMEQGLAAWHAAAPEREAIARENLIALATGIAKHVIGRELKTDARAIADLVRRALAHFPLREPVRIRLNPADLTAISTATDGAVRIATGRSVEWHADPELATGDCVVEAARRVVDGRVDRALERIYTKLIDA